MECDILKFELETWLDEKPNLDLIAVARSLEFYCDPDLGDLFQLYIKM